MSVTGVRNSVFSAAAYVAGKTIEEVQREYGLKDVIKLGSNENPYGPFPAAMREMQAELNRLNEYPDASFLELRGKLGELMELTADHIAIGHGAGGILETIAGAFLEPGDEAIVPTQSYGLYREISKVAGAKIVEVPLTGDYRLNIAAMRAAMSERTKIVWLCNPNNPTGTVADPDDIHQLAEQLPSQAWLVIDEAYAEFAKVDVLPDVASLVERHRVIGVRTFSKAYALAGGRIGYCIAHPDVIGVVDTVSEPFNANRVGIAGALASITEDLPVARSAIQALVESRAALESLLADSGFAVKPTETNFIFFDTGRSADELAQALLERGVIVRSASAWGYPQHLRVTVGTNEQNDRFLEAFREVTGLQHG